MRRSDPRAELCKLAEHFCHCVLNANHNSKHFQEHENDGHLRIVFEHDPPLPNYEPQMLEAGYVAGSCISEYLWSLFNPRENGPMVWKTASIPIRHMWYTEKLHKGKPCSRSRYLRKAKFKRHTDRRIAPRCSVDDWLSRKLRTAGRRRI